MAASTTKTNGLESREQVLRAVRKQPGMTLYTRTVHDDYMKLENLMDNFKVGNLVTAISSISGLDIPAGGAYVVAADLQRLTGARGRLIVTLSKREETFQWGLEMTEIQKPIKTWKADDTSDAPDLEQILQWELLRDSDRTSYAAYKYDGTTAMTGNTLLLAKMIAEEGIEAYAVYTPIVTRTSHLNEVPDDIGADCGKIVKTSSYTSDAAAKHLFDTAEEWLKTTDRITQALDGTFTRVEAWTGADKWNPNLYESAS